MTDNAGDLARVRNRVLLLSGVAWVALLTEPGGMAAHCMAGMTPLAMNPPMSLAGGWGLMLVAMMSPVLIPALCHIRLRSFPSRRARSSVLFVGGYAAVWMAFGAVLMAAALAAQVVTPQVYLPAAVVALIAVIWQCSPVKQRFLNRCHAHTELAAFGAAADRDALGFGVTHGIWCAGSCWALMLFPMLLPRGHAVAMAAVSLVIFSERLEHPMPPRWRWRWRGVGKARRIAIAQARIRLQAVTLQN